MITSAKRTHSSYNVVSIQFLKIFLQKIIIGMLNLYICTALLQKKGHSVETD